MVQENPSDALVMLQKNAGAVQEQGEWDIGEFFKGLIGKGKGGDGSIDNKDGKVLREEIKAKPADNSPKMCEQFCGSEMIFALELNGSATENKPAPWGAKCGMKQC